MFEQFPAKPTKFSSPQTIATVRRKQ